MRTIFASAALMAVSYAQSQLISGNQCCPRSCAAFSENMCCQQCPDKCNESPSQNTISLDTASCSQTLIKWTVPESCAPITQIDIECQDRYGNFNALPAVFGDRAQWILENDHLRASPFHLRTGDNVVCQVRSVNRCGEAPYSPMSQPIYLQECVTPAPQPVPVAKAPEEPCGFACHVKEACANGACGINSGQDIVNAANLIKAADDGDKFNWLFPQDYFNSWGKKQVMNKAAAQLPYFNQVFNQQRPGAGSAGGCGCAGQSNCACAPQQQVVPVADQPKTVKHKHAYKKKPQFKTVINEIKYTEMEKKIEMRPVEEVYTKQVMEDKVVEKPRTVMHMMTRTRQVPQIKQRTVMQLQTNCQKVSKNVPIEATVDCPCNKATDSACSCGPKGPDFTPTIVDECDQVEVPRTVQYTEMVNEPYEVQVPTTYIEKISVQVPKTIREVRTVQKAFEIEIPVEKIKREAVQVPIPVLEDSFYEHQHVGGEEAHSHGAAVDPDTVTDADPCAAHNCPIGKMAFKATDGVCYCTVM